MRRHSLALLSAAMMVLGAAPGLAADLPVKAPHHPHPYSPASSHLDWLLRRRQHRRSIWPRQC